MRIQRTLAAALIGAAAFSLAVPHASAAETKAPKDASKLKENLKRLYGKLDFKESIARGEVMTEIHGIVSKDKKDNALKYTAWWSEQILESLYTGDKFVKGTPKTKEIVKAELDVFPNGDERPAAKAPFVYRAGPGTSKTRSSPLLICVVDSKSDPAKWIEKAWLPQEEIAKDWVIAAVAEGPAFDIGKDPVAVARLLGRMFETYNVDPNRVFLEGVGPAASKAVQLTAMWALPDRLAGVVLRNPAEALANVNQGLHTTVVVRGAEGGDAAAAVLAKVKEAAGADRGVEVVAPDAASLDGNCQGLADWLKAAKPRETARSYKWIATFDKDNVCRNSYTGTILLRTPVKREEPTTVEVTFARDTNTVTVKCTNLGEFVVFMNDDLLDLDKEVGILVNDQPVVKRVFERNTQTMLSHADDFVEWGRLFPAQHTTVVPSQIAAADGGKGPAPGDGEKK